jgi:hypothetical protein
MTREVFEQRLAPLTSRQESSIAALVAEYRKDLADVQSTAVRYSQTEGKVQQQALSLIAQLGETAVEWLASTLATQKPGPDTALLMDMVDGFVAGEAAVISRLKAALSDQRMVPQPPEMRMIEEVGPPYRVCDEAYTALRRVLHSESRVQNLQEARHFLNLPNAAKDEEIESCLKTGLFTRFLGDVDAEEE